MSRPAPTVDSLEQRIDDLERRMKLLLREQPAGEESTGQEQTRPASAIEVSPGNVMVLGSPEHAQQLQRANQVRMARAKLKGSIAEGRTTVADVVLGCPWEAASMTFLELLLSQRRRDPGSSSQTSEYTRRRRSAS
jgi:hypothetical protein